MRQGLSLEIKGVYMGQGANRNKLCRCGSGKKIKNCRCKLSALDKVFPNSRVIDLGNGTFFHVLGIYESTQYSEFQDMKEKKYAPFYSPEQIQRIINPTTAKDVLLKKQADSIVDNIRVLRVFYNKYNRSSHWDFERIFDDSIFERFKCLVSAEVFFNEIKDIPCGMTYDSAPNGHCIKTQYGNIITISAILKEFLYYMNLFYMGCTRGDIPNSVTWHSLVLAMRIMLKSEALDFELDSRGEIPVKIDNELIEYTTGETLFVIAHEFSHSILKHLDSKNVLEAEDNYVYYNKNQLQEFEADVNAIHILKSFMDEEIAVSHAVNFFMAMDLYEQVKEQVSPSIGNIETHPKSIDRIKRLLEEFPVTKFDFEELLLMNKSIKDFLMNLVSTQFDTFEMYGSVYLGEWHKVNKIDRVDY